jgi:hypothetical protein
MNRPYRWAITGDCPYKNLDPGSESGMTKKGTCRVPVPVALAKAITNFGPYEGGRNIKDKI